MLPPVFIMGFKLGDNIRRMLSKESNEPITPSEIREAVKYQNDMLEQLQASVDRLTAQSRADATELGSQRQLIDQLFQDRAVLLGQVSEQVEGLRKEMGGILPIAQAYTDNMARWAESQFNDLKKTIASTTGEIQARVAEVSSQAKDATIELEFLRSEQAGLGAWVGEQQKWVSGQLSELSAVAEGANMGVKDLGGTVNRISGEMGEFGAWAGERIASLDGMVANLDRAKAWAGERIASLDGMVANLDRAKDKARQALDSASEKLEKLRGAVDTLPGLMDSKLDALVDNLGVIQWPFLEGKTFGDFLFRQGPTWDEMNAIVRADIGTDLSIDQMVEIMNNPEFKELHGLVQRVQMTAQLAARQASQFGGGVNLGGNFTNVRAKDVLQQIASGDGALLEAWLNKIGLGALSVPWMQAQQYRPRELLEGIMTGQGAVGEPFYRRLYARVGAGSVKDILDDTATTVNAAVTNVRSAFSNLAFQMQEIQQSITTTRALADPTGTEIQKLYTRVTRIQDLLDVLKLRFGDLKDGFVAARENITKTFRPDYTVGAGDTSAGAQKNFMAKLRDGIIPLQLGEGTFPPELGGMTDDEMADSIS